MTSDQDNETTFKELCELLAVAGFGWVVDNIGILVENGIRHEYDLPRYQESNESQTTRNLRERQEKVIGIRTVNPSEKILIALDEIERCIILPLTIANVLPSSLAAGNRSLDAIEIIDDETSDSVFTIKPGSQIGSSFVADLARAVQQVREKL